jgi:hypothetical protein
VLLRTPTDRQSGIIIVTVILDDVKDAECCILCAITRRSGRFNLRAAETTLLLTAIRAIFWFWGFGSLHKLERRDRN